MVFNVYNSLLIFTYSPYCAGNVMCACKLCITDYFESQAQSENVIIIPTVQLYQNP